jgi:uncharacterized protein (TIRG00374 family)
MTNPARRSKLGLIINALLVALAFSLLGWVIWNNRQKIRQVFGHPLDGSDLQVMSWGDGLRVPTSGQNLVVAGIDHNGLLHIRTFDTAGVRTDTLEANEAGSLHLVSADASGNVLSDTPESSLPTDQSLAIAPLKGTLPGLLPPHVLTNQDREVVLSQATSIIGHTSLDLRLLALALAIYVTGLVSTFFRWFFLVRVIDERFTLRAAMLLGFIGNVFNLVIPGAVGGDLIKAAYLARMHIKKTQAIASMVIDRIVGLLGLFILASIGGLIAWRASPPIETEARRLIMAAWFATGFGVLVLAAIFGQVFTAIFPRLGRGHSRLSLIVSELKEMSTTYRRRLDVVSFCTLMSMGNHSLNVIAFYLVGRMLFPAMTTTVAQHFLMAPLTLFTMAVPLPFGALGISELVAVQFFNLVGHPGGDLAMMGFRVLMYAGGLIGAIVYLAKLNEVRGLTAAAHHIEEELREGELDDDERRSEP